MESTERKIYPTTHPHIYAATMYYAMQAWKCMGILNFNELMT